MLTTLLVTQVTCPMLSMQLSQNHDTQKVTKLAYNKTCIYIIYKHMCVSMCVCVRMYFGVCKCVNVCVYVFVCVFAYVCM